MPANTIYSPVNVNSLESLKLDRNDDGVCGIATAGQTTNFDYAIGEDDHLLLGAELIVEGGAQGDYVKFEVVDKDGVFAPAGTVLKRFIRKRYVKSLSYLTTVVSRFPAKPKAGLYLRVVYVSAGEADVFVAVNYDISKVLV